MSPNFGHLEQRQMRKKSHTNGHVGFDVFDIYAEMVAIPVEFIIEDVELWMHFGFVGSTLEFLGSGSKTKIFYNTA